VCSPEDVCDSALNVLREAAVKGQTCVDDAPQCLLQMGLLQPMAMLPGLLNVVPPATAASVAMRPHEEAASAAARRLAMLSESFRRAEAVFNAALQELQPDTITLRDLPTINRVIDAAVAGCTTDLMTAQPGGARPPEILDSIIARSLETLGRGVRQRTIYQHAVRSHGPTVNYILQVVASGAEIRTVDKVFDRLIICDRRVCFISYEAEGEEMALEVQNPGVVAFLVKVFEHMWDRSIAVEVANGFRPKGVLTDIERSVARMIVSGSTEDKIARHLGISRRTVAEYASRLARHVGSNSRAQLGYLIATHGLLEDPDIDPGQVMLG
jgi:DNA-binding CsgD family transcriptional regulator